MSCVKTIWIITGPARLSVGIVRYEPIEDIENNVAYPTSLTICCGHTFVADRGNFEDKRNEN